MMSACQLLLQTYEDAGSQLVEAGHGRRVSAGAAVEARTPLEVLLRV